MNLKDINLDNILTVCTAVHWWGYREAWACSKDGSAPRNHMIMYSEVYKSLPAYDRNKYEDIYSEFMVQVRTLGKKCIRENHTTFALNCSGQRLYLTFHDGNIWIGDDVRGEYYESPKPTF